MLWLRLALVCLAAWLGRALANPIELETDGIYTEEEVLVNIIKKERKETCLHEWSYGNCHGYRLMWYFDPATDGCKRFHYSNCGGNDNRFYTYSECMELCSDYNLKSISSMDQDE